MLIKLFIVFSLSLQVLAIDPSWQSVKTRINHKIWRKDKQILVFKKRLHRPSFSFKKYQDKTIENKAKVLKLIGANNWVISNSKKLKKKLYLQGSYVDNTGTKTYFLEAHYYYKTELRQFLLTSKKKLPKLTTSIKDMEKLLNEYL